MAAHCSVEMGVLSAERQRVHLVPVLIIYRGEVPCTYMIVATSCEAENTKLIVKMVIAK